MDKPFLKRWTQASRSARSAVLANAMAPAIFLLISGTYLWAASNPVDQNQSPSVTGRGRIFELIARNPNPFLRFSVDLPFALFFGGTGIFLLRGVTPPFALDRWKPPVEDDTKQDRRV